VIFTPKVPKQQNLSSHYIILLIILCLLYCFIYFILLLVSSLAIVEYRVNRQRISMTSTLKTLSSCKWDSKASFLDACCTYFLYLSIGLHASNLCQNCGNTYVSYYSMHYPCSQDLGRILVIFTSCLDCHVWG
jgi:hypothetical protein